MNQTPKFTHDCKKCQYLGTTLGERGNAHDWYRCGDSVLARYGHEGSQYWSMLTSMVMDDGYLTTAYHNDPSQYLYINEKMITARFMLQRKASRLHVQWAVVMGNPFDGMQMYGPFDERDEAVAHARRQLQGENWLIAEIEPQENMRI